MLDSALLQLQQFLHPALMADHEYRSLATLEADRSRWMSCSDIVGSTDDAGYGNSIAVVAAAIWCWPIRYGLAEGALLDV